MLSKSGTRVPCQYKVLAWSKAAETIASKMQQCGAFLGGIYPVPIPHVDQALKYPPVVLEHFMCGDFLVIDTTSSAPAVPLFDESFHCKESLDYSAQHLQRFGKVRAQGSYANS
jgi:hypothetical protein